MHLQGTRREDVPEVTTVVRRAADLAGLEQIANRLLRRDQLPFRANPDVESDESYLFDYPYRYPIFDALMARWVSPELVHAKRAALVELSSALLYADRAPQAYSLLSRMRALGPDCEVQLNLAQAVALGFAPRSVDVDREFGAAVVGCPGDPTPLVEWARAVFARETRGAGWYLRFKVGALGQENNAVTLARRAQAVSPADPAGYLAEAGMVLEVADKYTSVNQHPFTARAMYRRALTLLDAVHMVLPSDPSVQVARAQALHGLGRDEEAVQTAGVLVSAFRIPDERESVADVVQQAWLNLGNAEAAQGSVTEDTSGRDLPDPCRSLAVDGVVIDGELAMRPEPGWQGACYTHLVDATGGEWPGGQDAVDSVSYIPRFRHEWIDPAALAAYAGRALPDDSSGQVSAVLSGDLSHLLGSTDGGGLIDTINDQLRRLGRYQQAEAVVEAALDAGVQPRLLLLDRLGETQYLQGDFAKAAALFDAASRADSTDLSTYPPYADAEHRAAASVGHEWAIIKQATAQYRMEPDEAALQRLHEFVIAKPQPVDTWEWDSALQEVARSSLAGTIELKLADYTASIVDLAKALSVCSMWHGSDVNPCGLGVQDNNIAVAMLHVGDFSSAEEHARTAIATDPDNALYVEALANIKEQAGDLEAAAQEYRATLALDPSQSSARNNLGVILAKSGAVGGAVEQFRFAVGAQPDYAVAWFNLGLALERQGAPRQLP